MTKPAARFTPLRAWCRTTGPGRVAAMMFEIEVPASGIGWESLNNQPTGDRHENVRIRSRNGRSSFPCNGMQGRARARSEGVHCSSPGCRTNVRAARKNRRSSPSSDVRSPVGESSPDGRIGRPRHELIRNHSSSPISPAFSFAGTHPEARSCSIRAVSSATSVADGAFSQSRNQVRRLMSGGPRRFLGNRAHQVGSITSEIRQRDCPSRCAAYRNRQPPAGPLVSEADHVERRALAAGQLGDFREHRAPNSAGTASGRDEVWEVHRAHSITVSVMRCQYRFGNLPIR